MNTLVSSSWRRDANPTELSSIRSFTGTAAAGASLDRFFGDVESIKDDLKEIDRLHLSLHEAKEESKTLHVAAAVRDLRGRVDADVAAALMKAKVVKLRLEALERGNAANRAVAGCGPGTSTDQTRTSVVAVLRKKLKDQMDKFQELRKEVTSEYKETIERRYYTVTGEKPDEQTVETLMSTGEGERFLERDVQEQGRGRVADVIAEIQERHGMVKELEKSLLELHQVFLDVAVLVKAQGEQLDDIESQVVVARTHQKITWKWICLAAVLQIIIISLIVLRVVCFISCSKNRKGV